MSAAGVIIAVGVALLSVAAVLVLVRMGRGPSTLDRVVAADVIVAIVIAGLAMEASLNKHTTTLPVMIVLSLLGFSGALSMARFVADRDAARKWDVPPEVADEAARAEGGPDRSADAGESR